MNATTPKTENLPTRTGTKKLRDCKTLKEAFGTEELRELIAQAAPKFIDPQAMLRTWVQAAAKSPLIYEADMRQALGAFQSLAFLGLQPNTHLGLAHVIPFKRTKWNAVAKRREEIGVELQVIIGYGGYVELAHRSNAITSFHADVVYDPDAEHFDFSHGSNKHLTHGGRRHDMRIGPDDAPLYAYAWARMTNGDDQFEVMPWYEVELIRDRSQAYRQALGALEKAKEKGYRVPSTWSEAPWVRDMAEMGKKTAARRFFKWVPKSPELRAASALEDAQERGDIDWGPVIDGEASPMDGNIPVADRDEGPDTTRTTVQVTKPPAETAAGILQVPKQDNRPEARQEPKPKVTDVPQDQQTPVFSAYVIDEYGEIASDELTDPAVYSKALVAHWRKMPDKTLTEQLLDHNSDAINTIAQEHKAASAILAEIEPEQPETGEVIDGEFEDASEEKPTGYHPAATLALVGADNTPDWKTYPNEIKISLAATAVEHLPDWLGAQRETLAAAPAQHRLIAVKAITTAFAAANLHPHPWLAETIKPKPKTDAAPAAPEQSTDAKWAEGHLAEIANMAKMLPPTEALKQIKAFAANEGTKTVMRRLRQQNVDGDAESGRLYDLVDGRYAAILEALGDKR